MHLRRLLWPTVATLALLAPACSDDGGDDESSGRDATSTTAAAPTDDTDGGATDGSTPDTTEGGGPDDTSAPAGDGALPAFMSDFSQVCTTQVGFSGAAAYDGEAGPHPIVLFEEVDGTLIQSARALPEGWTVEEDSDFEDNSELAGVELVGCSTLLESNPNGTMCDLDDDGETITLELADTSWELTVHEAATGEPVGEPVTLTAESTECPFFVIYEEGDTTYDIEPSDDDYINALRDRVEP